jgi:hypothetical protein
MLDYSGSLIVGKRRLDSALFDRRNGDVPVVHCDCMCLVFGRRNRDRLCLVPRDQSRDSVDHARCEMLVRLNRLVDFPQPARHGLYGAFRDWFDDVDEDAILQDFRCSLNGVSQLDTQTV